MQKYTHLFVGGVTAALVGWLLYQTPINLERDWDMILALTNIGSTELSLQLLVERMPLIIQGAVLAILPDLDQLFKGLLSHRCGLSHSIITYTIFAPIGTVIFCLFLELPLNLVILSGTCVFTHWLIDALNPSGVRTIGLFTSFFIKHRCDFRLAKIRYNNHVANLILCTLCFAVLFLLSPQPI